MNTLYLASEAAEAAEAVEASGPWAPAHALFDLFGLPVTSPIVTAWVVIAFIVILSVAGTRRLKRVPGRFQAAFEVIINFLIDGVIAPAIGGREKAIKYLPFLGAIFLFIIVSNYSGLLPGAVLDLPGFKPPTSELGVTAALAVMAFLMTHYVGIREKGLHHFGHLLQPFPWLLPLNLIEEFIRPLSLALRLFGNIRGGETIMWVLLLLVPWFVPLPIMALEVFFGFLQAFIFTTLTAVYIGGATADSH